MKITILMLLVLPLLALQCEEENPVNPLDQLPPATHTGEYTFGCLVNGEAFVPESTRDIGAIYQGNVLQIYGEFDGWPGEYGISLDIRSPIQTDNEYDLTNDPLDVASYGGGGVNVPICQYKEENTLSGTLKITHFDSINYIVSGTFEFVTAIDEENCDTIRVTDGRFDIPYIT